MNVNKMIKKLAILAILAMFLTLNFSTTLGKFEKLNDDGIWIDEFNDTEDISELNKCVNETGKIKLKKGTPETTYNYKEYPDNVKAWYQELGITGGGLFGDLINKFISPSLAPGNPVEKTDMSVIGRLDNKVLTTESIGSDVYIFSPMHHFQFKIKQSIDDINKITLKWFFGSYQPVDEVNLKEISMWVWSYGNILPVWTQVGSSSIVYNQSNVGSTDVNKPDLSCTLTKDMLYVNDDGYIDILIVGTPKNSNENAILNTDYVEAIVTTKGYLTEGYIISTVIQPPDFGRWEKVFWNGTKTSETASITIQVLDKNGDAIEGFSSKTSPLDISSITATSIRLKAILQSSASDVTPSLDSWGVMWQKKEGYNDNFSYAYRISKVDGVSVKNGDVKINEFYGDWSIFGKNSANTRSYVGNGLTSKPVDLYWYSKGYNVGGGFRQPVTSNGKVYIASGDKKIYIFNETVDSKTGKQTPVNTTKALYEVSSCIAATDELLIVGTCEPNKANKVYALDLLSNLSNVKWSYPNDDENICFSSPPTIDNGRIFITTWSGLPWDLPITSVLSKFLSLNNKLIALDVSTGDPLWNPVTLPAGSFSAPAVGNDMVFVGCQNMWGSSLFAYDIDTGKEIWNTSVGIIGRSCPVYADGKVFVLTRQKENISSYGENKIVAVDANSGDELWNKTLPGNTTTSLLNLLKGPDFYWMISGVAPISTPAYADDTLFVLSLDGRLMALNPENGKEKWSYELVDNSFITHYVTSPVVVNHKVYVVTGKGTVYTFNTMSDNESVEPLWSYQIERPSWIPPWVDVLASPIISNGLLIVSATEDEMELTGGLYCIGRYSPNSAGELISNSIHVPYGYWWNEFNATIHNATDNNTITFSILNEDNSVLKTIKKLDGVENKILDVNSNVIKLKAFFEISNSSEPIPILSSWQVNWVEEKKAPEFINDSFEPGENGWINNTLSECSIEVRDLSYNNVMSGLDTNTARFRIGYIPKGKNKPVTSKWYNAIADDASGVTQTRIRAKLQDLKLDISKLKNITFSIKDLAGNEAISNTISFKIDILKPESWIKNINSYKSQYNEPVVIEANASDPGDPGNSSGISSVTLKYRKSTDGENYGEWKTFDTPRTPDVYSWEFGVINNEPLNGSYYQIVTIARDKAGNEEELNENKINQDSVTFLFDMKPPTLENQFEIIYKATHLPVFNLKLHDDYKLDSISYRFDAGDWVEIKSNINEAVFNITWSLPETLWESMRINETHSVFFKITDAIGNEYTTTDNPLMIVKDEDISKFYVDLSSFHEWHWDDKFTITAQYPEDIPIENIKLYYKYSEDNKNWPDQWIQYGDNQTIAPFKWVFTAVNGSGYYKFKTEITDTAGIVYTSPVETINVTIFPTTLFMLMIILTIFLILSTAAIFLKIKKRKEKK